MVLLQGKSITINGCLPMNNIKFSEMPDEWLANTQTAMLSLAGHTMVHKEKLGK